MITNRKKKKKNYKDQFLINKILNDEIEIIKLILKK
jgi:hypothetical protein